MRAGGQRRNRDVEKSLFGRDAADGEVWLFRMRNGAGMEVTISNYGGIVQSILTPDRQGRLADVVLGFDTLEGYVRNPTAYFGALLGRYASRIGHARFALGGRTCQLAANNGRHCLHGGSRGFDKRTWTVTGEADRSIWLEYVSADGEEGFPGELRARAIYTLTDANELRLDLEAETGAETVVNLTDHSDFHLAGDGSGDVLGHELTLMADSYLPVADGLVPTGEIRPVEGTPFDFRKPRRIGAALDHQEEQLVLARGFDHTFPGAGWDGSLRPVARVFEPRSGRVLELETTQPGVHFYSGNALDGSVMGKSGRRYEFRGTFYLGAQHFPDSPNQPAFPATILRPGETFRATNLYRFSVDAGHGPAGKSQGTQC